jgi:hypothetical protein
MNDIGVDVGINIDIELSLRILLDTAEVYMRAFDFSEDTVKNILDMQQKYQAFNQVTCYYFDGSNECIAYVDFRFDWKQYKVICISDDPDVIRPRENIVGATPKKILEDVSNVIKKKLASIKAQRNYTKMSCRYFWSSEISSGDKEIVRNRLNLVPIGSDDKIKFSDKMHIIAIPLDTSLTEQTLAVEFVL